jgi:hypothetical protein
MSTSTSTFTQAHLAAIEEAIAGGYLKVRYDDKEVTYQSIDQMVKARAMIQASLAATASPVVRIDYPTFVRDYE